jgi:phosphohistidine phosphatase
MEVLILMRHGKAVGPDEAATDKARGLTERGRREAREAGEHLADARLAPDRILVSTATRTRETYAALAGKPAGEADFVEALYMADSEQIWAEAVRSGGDVVMVIGHNPGLHDLAADLIAQAHDRSALGRMLGEHMPTSAYAAFSLSGSTLRAAGPRLLSAWSAKE